MFTYFIPVDVICWRLFDALHLKLVLFCISMHYAFHVSIIEKKARKPKNRNSIGTSSTYIDFSTNNLTAMKQFHKKYVITVHYSVESQQI